MANLKVGPAAVSPDLPSHVAGISQGNAKGNYDKMAGHEGDGTSTARRSTGINAAEAGPIDPSMPNLSPA